MVRLKIKHRQISEKKIKRRSIWLHGSVKDAPRECKYPTFPKQVNVNKAGLQSSDFEIFAI